MYQKERLDELGEWEQVSNIIAHQKTKMEKYRKYDYKYVGVDDPQDATTGERIAGYMWEKIAHLDTPINTKFLQIRSPIEQYERHYLYGADFTNWAHPVSTILAPAFRGFSRHNPVKAAILGGVAGSMFGARGPAKAIAATVGAVAGGVMSMGARADAAMSKYKVYIPDNRKKEWEINEYFDVLEYVKNTGLFEKYNKELKKQGIDLKKTTEKQASKLFGPMVQHAMEYQRRMQHTAYGAKSDEMSAVLSAVPASMRDFWPDFMRERHEKDRERIYNEVPLNLKRFLAHAWSQNATKWKLEAWRQDHTKPNLAEYFEHHALPPSDWAGWSPNTNLNEYKIKVVDNEGLNSRSLGLWDDVEVQAASHQRRTLDWKHGTMKRAHITHQLRTILAGHGVTNADVRVDMQDYYANSVDMDLTLQRDHTGEIVKELYKGGWKTAAAAHESQTLEDEQQGPFMISQ